MFKKKEEKQKVEETETPAEANETSEKTEAKEPSPDEKSEERPTDAQTIEQSEQSEQSEKSNNSPKPEPDWKSLYAVTLADFDNYKKRAARDREDVYRYAESDILKDILPTVDNLALALQNAKDKDNEFVKGVQMVYDGLLKALADHGAKPMAELVGNELDPNFHEAIATLPSDTVEEGRISNVAKTGWTLNDKLLRAAQVVVSAGKPA